MKMLGYIEGVEVIFEYFPPNQFKANIPRKLNGIYNIQLKCIDDGGNENGLSEMYVYVDIQNMIFKVLDKVYTNEDKKEEYTSKELTNNYYHKELII